MAPDDVILASQDTALETLRQIGSIANWLQAIGIIVIIWIILSIVNWYINRKRIKLLNSLQQDIGRLESKIDKLAKKK